MATTYLDLTNEVLRELNEIPLTSANFSSAVGLQQFVKDAVNKSIFDIANAEGDADYFDFMANGFKLKTTSSGGNGSGHTFIYAAWGALPFKYGSGVL